LKKILVVDDEPNNLQILKQVLENDYQLLFANRGELALEVARIKRPDLILLDIMMPGMNGYETCEELKRRPETANIPVIFVSAMGEVENEVQGFDAGAVDYVLKPISPTIVRRRIRTHLQLVRAENLEKSQRAAVFMLGEAGHYNDTDTGQHIWRMAAYAKQLASLSGWSTEMTARLELAAPMHDTGKIGVPDEILKAPRKLTADEWVIMKAHSWIGYDILQKGGTPLFDMAAEVALNHHEKWDGSGYPSGLKEEQIPESARIVALADVFDALTMVRPYKDAWSVEDATKYLLTESGSHFDPRLVQLFEDNIESFYRIKEEWQSK
jgi:putative two-component system response regulator